MLNIVGQKRVILKILHPDQIQDKAPELSIMVTAKLEHSVGYSIYYVDNFIIGRPKVAIVSRQSGDESG